MKDFILFLVAFLNAINPALASSLPVSSVASNAAISDFEPEILNYLPPMAPPPMPPPPGDKSRRQGIITRKSTAKSNKRPSKILNLPFPDHLDCLDADPSHGNVNRPECAKFYKIPSACPLITDPVFDKDGNFYPSPCWAEVLGVKEYQKGKSERLQKFIKDLWYTPKSSPMSHVLRNHGWHNQDATEPAVEFDVPNPSIEFTYTDVDFSKGPALRSRIWQDNTGYSDLIYYFSDRSTSVRRAHRFWPTIGRKKALMVFLDFSEAYPEQVLLDFTKSFGPALNNYFKHNQNISDPIQYDFTPVVIPLPIGITEKSLVSPDGATLTVNDAQAEKIYKAALDKLQISSAMPTNFDMLAWVPVTDNVYKPHGGYFGGRPSLAGRKLGAGKLSWVWAGVSLHGHRWSPDKNDQLFAQGQFNAMFSTLSHEILHGLGMDHALLEQSPRSLISSYTNGLYCDNLGTLLEQSSALAIKMPSEFSIRVGNEPPGASVVQSGSGACVSTRDTQNLKDWDNDGIYELIYSPEDIGEILKNLEGWTDIDGDGVAEIVDPTPYGGLKVLNVPTIQYAPTLGPATFTPIKEVRIKNCRFQKIKLSSGETGLLPLSCPEFDSIRTDVYRDVQYYWTTAKKSYGLVLVAKQ